VGLELVAHKGSREPFPPAPRTGHRVILAARQLGAILRPLGDVIVLMPPLCITPEELDTLCDITAAAIGRGTAAG
jgi:adenosylmethionine-8-amino-7-oxononanoate aminotransferase